MVILTDNQIKIMRMLNDTGGVEPAVLSESLKLDISELEKDIRVLQNMGKIDDEIKDSMVRAKSKTNHCKGSTS